MSHLASWYRKTELNLNAERMISQAVIQAGAETPRHPNTATLPGDPWLLRGIPVVGVHGGVGGASPGTKPGSSRNW